MTGRRIGGSRKPRTWKAWLNLAVTVLVLCLGPAMMVVGTVMINADQELERTGSRTVGTIVHFDDVTKASQRRIQVDYTEADGSPHRTFAAVDHDQHPVVGSGVPVIYAADDPGRAVVPGYESDGVWFQGAGTVLTLIFAAIGILALVMAWVGALRGHLRKRRTQRIV